MQVKNAAGKLQRLIRISKRLSQMSRLHFFNFSIFVFSMFASDAQKLTFENIVIG